MEYLKTEAQKIVDKPGYAFLSRTWKAFFPVISLTWFALVLVLILYTVSANRFWDFNVFYSSAQAALRGENIYRLYGTIEELPYWYFPWTSWLFIPFAIFSFDFAKILISIANFISLVYLIWVFNKHFSSRATLLSQIYIFAMSLFMCWLLFKVGQVDFILAALVVAVMFMLERKQYIQAGIIIPILLFKPHLLLIFFPVAAIRGGKKFILSVSVSMVVLSLISFSLIPNWPTEMVRMLSESGQRTDNYWDFIVFTELIGLNENWSGTENLPVLLGLVLIAFVVVWQNRHLSTVELLTLALSASMFCAPRAYTYNLPFVIPSLLWISLDKKKKSVLLWTIVGIISFVSRFSTWSFLIIVIAFIASIIKANKLKPELVK
jgi:hypothetical protein